MPSKILERVREGHPYRVRELLFSMYIGTDRLGAKVGWREREMERASTKCADVPAWRWGKESGLLPRR